MYRLRQLFWALVHASTSFVLGWLIYLIAMNKWLVTGNGNLECLLLILIVPFVWSVTRVLDYIFDPHKLLGHHFSHKKIRVDGCVEYCQCIYCLEKEFYGSHNMQKLVKDGAHVCSYVMKCAKCDLETEEVFDHDYFSAPSEADLCVWENRCTKCGEKRYSFESHAWELPVHDPSSNDPCDMVIDCKNCEEKKFSKIHSFTSRDDVCEYEAACARCGTVETFQRGHVYDDSHSGYCIRCYSYTGMDNNGYVGYY